MEIPGKKSILELGSFHSSTHSGHECSYCVPSKPNNNFQTWGLNSHKMSTRDYESLLQTGWRRCGAYYYKPDLAASCCQLYTIRLKAKDFLPNKKQKKVLKKFNRYLNGELEPKKESKILSPTPTHIKSKSKCKNIEEKNLNVDPILVDIDSIIRNIISQEVLESIKGKLIVRKEGKKREGDYSTNICMLLFHNQGINPEKGKWGKMGVLQEEILRKIRAEIGNIPLLGGIALEGCPNGFINFYTVKEEETKMEEKETPETPHIGDVPGESSSSQKSTFSSKIIEEFKVQPSHTKPTKTQKPTKGQKLEESKEITITNGYSEYLTEIEPNLNPNPKHKYTIEVVPALFTEESFEVFKKYEANIHGKPDKNPKSYKNFLCKNSLFDINNKREAEKNPYKSEIVDVDKERSYKKYIFPEYTGGYHMNHRINGRLIAVGVIDILPTILSSVYFFYDPEYAFLSPGVLGTIREIEYATKLLNIEYYCLGYYIQDCVKSVYKGEYFPSELLCPVTYTWANLDSDLRELIRKEGYAKLAVNAEDKGMLKWGKGEFPAVVDGLYFFGRKGGIISWESIIPEYIQTVKLAITDVYQHIIKDIALDFAIILK